MVHSSDVLVWATAVSTHAGNGRRIIFRYAKEFKAAFDKGTQPVRVIIAWKYQSANGQPNSHDHRRMNLLEDRLEHSLDNCTLALVSTGEDLREWIFYARIEAEFMARFNYALTDLPEFPIEIHVAHDPDWTTHQKLIEGVQG